MDYKFELFPESNVTLHLFSKLNNLHDVIKLAK